MTIEDMISKNERDALVSFGDWKPTNKRITGRHIIEDKRKRFKDDRPHHTLGPKEN